MKADGRPKCPICEAAHYQREPHVWGKPVVDTVVDSRKVVVDKRKVVVDTKRVVVDIPVALTESSVSPHAKRSQDRHRGKRTDYFREQKRRSRANRRARTKGESSLAPTKG